MPLFASFVYCLGEITEIMVAVMRFQSACPPERTESSERMVEL